jgi:hypothetical protein
VVVEALAGADVLVDDLDLGGGGAHGTAQSGCEKG